jgi:hypothetical protein
MATTVVRRGEETRRAGTASSMRFGAWCGVLLILFTFGADAIFLSAGFPDNTFTTRQVADYFIDHGAALLWAHVFFNLGSIVFVFFIAALWAILREAEGSPGWLANASAWGALLAIAAANASNAFGAVGANFGHDYPELASPQFAESMFQLSVAFNLSFVGFVVLQIGISVLSFRTGVFPRWIAWLGLIDLPLWLLQQWPVPRYDNALQELLFDRTGPAAHLLQMVWLIGVTIIVLRRTSAKGSGRGASAGG